MFLYCVIICCYIVYYMLLYCVIICCYIMSYLLIEATYLGEDDEYSGFTPLMMIWMCFLVGYV